MSYIANVDFSHPTAPTCSTTIGFVADYITKHLLVMTKLYGGPWFVLFTVSGKNCSKYTFFT